MGKPKTAAELREDSRKILDRARTIETRDRAEIGGKLVRLAKKYGKSAEELFDILEEELNAKKETAKPLEAEN